MKSLILKNNFNITLFISFYLLSRGVMCKDYHIYWEWQYNFNALTIVYSILKWDVSCGIPWRIKMRIRSDLNVNAVIMFGRLSLFSFPCFRFIQIYFDDLFDIWLLCYVNQLILNGRSTVEKLNSRCSYCNNLYDLNIILFDFLANFFRSFYPGV